ncbi:MAG: GGDEF domain-containing protein, partial [Thermoanaerobaculia bacterium]|nr:GGDEF domain-containing protein [Thermoanaerobaculia bacterium]
LDTALAVPLVSRERLVGLLLLGRRRRRSRGHRLPAEELELLGLLAHHTAIVFENVRLFESATYESLTGLLRREAIVELLDKEVARAQRYQRPLTVGMADLDHFKAVNDRHGHLAGDALLKRVAEELALCIRSTDALGRYGGEEFLLVFPETDLLGAAVVAEKIRSRIEALRVRLETGEYVSARISIGLASFDDLPRTTPAPSRALIDAADRALYRAKEAAATGSSRRSRWPARSAETRARGCRSGSKPSQSWPGTRR